MVWEGERALGADLRLVGMPGYTAGSAVLLHGETVAFTGGLVGGDGAGGLACPRADRAWSVERLRDSLGRLREVPFTTVHPAFGASWRGDAATRASCLDALARSLGADAVPA